jgi:hypothetical protein
VRPVISDTSAMNMATPALGPSLGMAPAGTCTWTSAFSKRFSSMPRSSARFLTIDSAACALSRITSPSWPVRMSLPEPGMRVASMNSMSPPTGVQARPVATPGTLVRMATSFSNCGEPRIVWRSSGVMRIFPLSPSAMRTAAWRSALPISRSRFRTPDSRV